MKNQVIMEERKTQTTVSSPPMRRRAKTGVERMRAYRARKSLLAAGIDPHVLSSDHALKAALYLPARPKQPPKSGAERMRALRERRKKSGKSGKDREVGIIVPSSASIEMQKNLGRSTEFKESVSEMRREKKEPGTEEQLQGSEIHDMLQSTVDLGGLEPYLKTKWKGLRDTFRCEMKKEQEMGAIHYRKFHSQSYKSSWKHYNDLLFLKEQMLPKPPIWERSARGESVDPLTLTFRPSASQNRPCKGTKRIKLKSAVSSCEAVAGHVEEATFINVKQEPEFIVVEHEENGGEGEDYRTLTSCDESSVVSARQNGDATCSTSDVGNRNTGGEESSADVGEMRGQFDDNYHFFMSLVPHMHKLSGERQMLVRMKIQEMIYKEVYKK